MGMLNYNTDQINQLLKKADEDIPVVPQWAMQSDKPQYTASEVGALPDTTKVIPDAPVDGNAYVRKNGGWVETRTIDPVPTPSEDTSILGEIRYSSKMDDPFGNKYVLCAGQEISTVEFPEAASALPISRIDTLTYAPYTNLSEGSYSDMMNEPFSINDNLLGKIRISAIMPSTAEPTEEDYIQMYASMTFHLDVSADGVNWTEKYRFPKDGDNILGVMEHDVANGELVLFCYTAVIDVENKRMTQASGPVMKTSDFENFQEWETINPILPDVQTNMWEIHSLCYGKGVYLGIITEEVNSQKKAALLKSTDLQTWEYATATFPSWTDVASDYLLSVFFSGNRWIVQFGYLFISDEVSQIDIDHICNIASDASIDHVLQGVFHYTAIGYESYIVFDNYGIYNLNKDNGNWGTSKVSTPSGWSSGELYADMLPLGNGLPGWMVFGKSGHYYSLPKSMDVQALAFSETTDEVIGDVYKLGTKIIIVEGSSRAKIYVADAFVSVPQLGNNNASYAFIKIKS